MKFKSEPNLHVVDFKTKRFLFKFDEKGEFETTDEDLIKRLSISFKPVEEKKVEPKKEIKKKTKG